MQNITMLTPDQQRVKDLLRETITLLCKNGLHFQSQFQIDGLIGITLDREDVFLVTLNETVHSGDVFIRDSKRKHIDESNRNYNDKRRVDHRRNNMSVKCEMSKDEFLQRRSEQSSSTVDIGRQRKSLVQSRVEQAVKSRNMISHDGNQQALKLDEDFAQQHSKNFSHDGTPNESMTLEEGNTSGNECCDNIQDKSKLRGYSDAGHEVGMLMDADNDDKKDLVRSMSNENLDEDNNEEDSDYRRNEDDDDENFRMRRDDDDDDDDNNDGGGGGGKTEFIRKTNSHKFLSPSVTSAVTNSVEDNDEEPLVVKVEPPDTSYHSYQQGSSQRPDNLTEGDVWNSSGHIARNHPNASSSRQGYQHVNDIFNASPSAVFRNTGKAFIPNVNKSQITPSMFNDNVQLHQQMLNTRQQPQQQQQQQQQQRGNNFNDLYTSLVDVTGNPGFPADEFLAGAGGDFLHVASQHFNQHQQMNRLLQRRQRSTFTRSQVKCLEDVFKTVHYVDASLRMKLSRQLNLSEGTINIWFQNRRQKLKKQQQQMMLNSNTSGIVNDESLMNSSDLNPSGGGSQMNNDFIISQSPNRPSNSSFSGSNPGSSPAYMQSPIHNNPPPSTHSTPFNPIDCPSFAFNSDSGKT